MASLHRGQPELKTSIHFSDINNLRSGFDQGGTEAQFELEATPYLNWGSGFQGTPNQSQVADAVDTGARQSVGNHLACEVGTTPALSPTAARCPARLFG